MATSATPRAYVRPCELAALDVELPGAHTIDAHEYGDAVLLRIGVLLDLDDTFPHALAKRGIVDDARLAVEAQRSPVPRAVPHHDRDLWIRAHRGLGLCAAALPPREVVGVPDHEAALQRDVGPSVVRRRDHPGVLPAL